MSDDNPLKDRATIDDYLGSLPHTVQRRGRALFQSGHVHDLKSDQPGVSYSATVISSGGDGKYQVWLDYAADEWLTECECPQGGDCKHTVAALLALHEQASQFKPASKVKPKKTPATALPPTPKSPLTAAVKEKNGRALNLEESTQLRMLLNFWDSVQRGYQMTASDLRYFTYGLNDFNWSPLKLWPEPPVNDLEFWQYLAHEILRRNLSLPAFLQPVTNLDRIKEKMKDWLRLKEIANWRQQLAQKQAVPLHQLNEWAELRLAFSHHAARLLWRSKPDNEFAELKQAHVKRLGQCFDSGLLEMPFETAMLWAAMYRPYTATDWHVLHYNDSTALTVLNRIFRLAPLKHLLTTSEGQPLRWHEQPLRMNLTAPKDAAGDYLLQLVTAEGQEPPAILAVLAGIPTLYLTADGVYHGPVPHGFGNTNKIAIPAPAVESLDGIQYLGKLALPLPERIQQLTRPVTMTARLKCEIDSAYVGGKTDYLMVTVTAQYEGGETEYYRSDQWVVESQLNYQPKPQSLKPGEMIPIVDRVVQGKVPGLLFDLGVKFDGYQGKWRVRITKTFPEMFVEWLNNLPPNVELLLDPELASLREGPVAGNVRLSVEEAQVDWFDLRVELDVKDSNLTQQELQLLLNAGGKFVRLGKKGWHRLQFNLSEEEDQQLARLGLNPHDFSTEPQRLHAFQLADSAAQRFLPQEQAQKIQTRASELKARVTPEVPASIRATLRPYQIEGFHFLAYLTANRFGGILADDMGLGKTVQALTWLAWSRSQTDANKHPSLVVCPKSVMDNWRSETERFLPELKVRLWQGEDADALKEARTANDLIVINYPQLRSLSPEIGNCQWHAAILDEAQYIKNPDSQTAQAARALKAQQRLALTGTPIENRLMDLWSIFAYAMPGVLGNRTAFGKRYNLQTDSLARQRLSARVRPFLLRRTKGQVAKDLPERVEEDLICELEGDQRTLYQAEYKRARLMLLKLKTQKELNEQRFHFLTSLLRLRQICCHPGLVNDTLMGAESAKVNALLDLLEPLLEEGHKVLVFSQFVTMLEILKREMTSREWRYFYLAGDTENRGELVASFQAAEGAAVFLISLKAGGFGLNLTAASYVVMFDPWWNPAVENQAIDRTHRIGQVNKVIAYRLLIKNSIEEKIRQLQKTKKSLAEDVLGEESFAKALTLDDLKYLFEDEI
ncbi:MAG: DEAD/DEAH box helicase [Verrucomicrobiota bacterium]